MNYKDNFDANEVLKLICISAASLKEITRKKGNRKPLVVPYHKSTTVGAGNKNLYSWGNLIQFEVVKLLSQFGIERKLIQAIILSIPKLSNFKGTGSDTLAEFIPTPFSKVHDTEKISHMILLLEQADEVLKITYSAKIRDEVSISLTPVAYFIKDSQGEFVPRNRDPKFAGPTLRLEIDLLLIEKKLEKKYRATI